ncbi:MAG TPA: HGGxSTG domain-containing protein [Gammaproteobacteria bacterium]|nr:HGGxSTG domain-containing protein [Gammaproteobacteria bacterium]
MRYGMCLWYDWRTDNIRFMMKTPRAKQGDWPRCGAHRRRDRQSCQARALANGRCKYHGGLLKGPRSPEGKVRALANLRQFQST